MKIGLMFFGSRELDAQRDKYRLIIEAARFADQSGFSSVWVPERHFTEMGCLYPNPAVLHAALARETKHVHLRAGSVVAPLHNAIRIAEEWAVVDNLSGGRVGVSFASGWHPADFTFFPERYARRHEEMFATIEAVRRLWRGEPLITTDGAGNKVSIRIYPTPIQKELPFWVTAANSPRTFQEAGAIGANLLTHMMDSSIEQLAERIALYREARAQHGHDPQAGEVSLMLHTFVGPDLEDVHSKAREPYCQYLEANAGLVKGLAKSRERDVNLSNLSPEERASFYNFLYDRFASSRGLIGTPETCRGLLSQLSDIGVNEAACLLDFGVDPEHVLAHLPYLDQLQRRQSGSAAGKRVDPSPAAARKPDQSPPQRPAREPAQVLAHDEVRARCNEEVSGAAFYEHLERHGVDLSPCFRGVRTLFRRDGEALAQVEWPPALLALRDAYTVHPAFLDACVQVFVATLPLAGPGDGESYLPTGVRSIRVYGPLGERVQSHAWLDQSGQDAGDGHVAGDIALYGENGELLAHIAGFRLTRFQGELPQGSWRDWIYVVSWSPRPVFGLRPDYLPALPDLGRRAAAANKEQLSRADDLAGQREALRRLEAVSLEYVLAAFSQCGVHLEPGASFSFAELAERMAVIPAHQRLLGRLLEMLAEDEIIAQRDGRWQVIRARAPGNPGHLLDELMDEYGAVAGASLTLLGRCAEKLADVMRGARDPVTLLFPDGDNSTLTQLYQESPVAKAMNTLVMECVLDAVTRLPAGRGLRILEVGAGTGSTTASLLPHLPAERVEYVFTDIGPVFTAKAKQKFAAYDFISYQTLDIERPPLAQGYEPHQYDIVIAANVLHATRDLRETLAHVGELLSPGGRLILLEATARSRWVDLTFGLLDGWWRSNDDRKDHPLLTQERWTELLLACGFQEVVCIPEHAPGAEPLGQAVIVAQGFERVEDTGRAWLIMGDERGAGDALREELRARGERVIRVDVGSEYEEASGSTFRIHPRRPQDYRRLLASLPPLHGVIYLGSLAAPVDAENEPWASSSRGCEELLYLAQELLRKEPAPPRVWLVTQGSQAVEDGDALLGVGQAALWGMARVAALEHPELKLVCVDLDGARPTAEQAASLWAEIAAPPSFGLRGEKGFKDREQEVALRGGRRYAARLSRPKQPAVKGRRELSCHAAATYLITGGLGGLGLRTARWLIERGARNLILAGRSQIDVEVGAQLDAMRSLGAEVTLARADVTDRQQMAELLSQIDESAPLRGVFHLASVFEMELFIRQDWGGFLEVLRPKVLGAWNLHELTESLPLDFFVLYSSRASLLPYPGLGGYAAGNAFLDALAHYRRSRGLPALTVNWGTWSEAGKMAQVSQREPQRLALGEGVIPPEQGLQALAHLMMNGYTQAGVMPSDWSVFLREQKEPPSFLAELAPVIASQSAQSEPHEVGQAVRQAAGAEQRALIQRQLQIFSARLLQLPTEDRVDPDLALLRLGLDSLMAIELSNQIDTKLYVKVPFIRILEGLSIAQITGIIQEQLARANIEAPAPAPDHGTIEANAEWEEHEL
jgi:natural product biosynthesis luciferase-like monooxygenase protein